MRYPAEGTPLVVLAGKEYGSGSSATGRPRAPYLLGVRAVIAESFERIHRSNLIGMGVLPLQFLDGESVESLGLTGHEVFTITGLEGAGADEPMPARLTVTADDRSFEVRLRIDTPKEAEYYRHGGILQYVLRQLAGADRDGGAGVLAREIAARGPGGLPAAGGRRPGGLRGPGGRVDRRGPLLPAGLVPGRCTPATPRSGS